MVSTLVSPNNLGQVLSEQLDGNVREVTLLPQNMAHRMYSAMWDQPDGPTAIIVRFFDGPRGDEEARTEANALRDIYRAGYPVPEFHLLVEDKVLAGAPFIVMQRLPGQPLGALALAQPERTAYWLGKASSLLLKLHGLKWQNGFDEFQPALDPLEFAERQIKWWARQAQTIAYDEITEGFTWLRGNLYRARRAKTIGLVHRDFHPNNLLAESDKISGVVDWGELTIADPAVDIGWSRMVLSTEVNPELGDTFTADYFRRNPEVAETLSFWEVFAACKRLTMIARRRQAAESGLSNNPSLTITPEAIEAIREFMTQRLTDDD